MKKFRLLLSPCLLMLLTLSSCGRKSDAVCHIQGHTTFENYDVAYLMSLDRNRLDSVVIEDGNFDFRSVVDSDRYAVVVRLVDMQTPVFHLEMPVIIESGTVRMEIGEYIYISGTPLNERIQDFLNALQNCKDALVVQKEIDIKKIKDTFSEFYRLQILANRDNALGKYIYHEYSFHLTDSDLEQVKAETGL